MQEPRRTLRVLVVIFVVIAAAIGIALLGFIRLPPSGNPAPYSLRTHVYTVSLTSLVARATFSASDFAGPFVLGANTTGTAVRGSLAVGAEVVLGSSRFTNMKYVYPYEAGRSGALQLVLEVQLLSGSTVPSPPTVVIIQLAWRDDLAAPPIIRGAVPTNTAASLDYSPFPRDLTPSAEESAGRAGNWTWAHPVADVCYGDLVTVRGGFWVNITAAHNTSYGLSLAPAWSLSSQFDMNLWGNAAFHAHAPANVTLALQWAVCKPSNSQPINMTVDSA